MRLQVDEPLSEQIVRWRMRLHHLLADPAAARQAFERFATKLHDEFGTTPDAETTALLETVAPPSARRRVRGAEIPVTLLRPPVLVGRAAALEQAVLSAASQQVLLVTGDAGIGKTRFFDELAALAADGSPQALRSAARPGDADIPYVLIRRMLDDLAKARQDPGVQVYPDTLAAIMSQSVSGEVRGRGLSPSQFDLALEDWLLAAARGGRPWLIDDLHFADAASLLALQRLLTGPARSAWRWALAARVAEGSPALAMLREALVAAQAVREVALGALQLHEVSALINSLGLPGVAAADWAEALLRHSGGNPLFLLETLKEQLLGRGIDRPPAGLCSPALVQEMMAHRLRLLSAPALDLARVAALADRRFSVALASRVLQVEPLRLSEPWAELEAAQVLRGAAFAHELMRDAVRSTVPAVIAEHLHGLIAAFLEDQQADAATVGRHWEQARCFERAGRALRSAARQAASLQRREEEAALLGRAAQALQAAGLHEEAFTARLEQLVILPVVAGIERADELARELIDSAPNARMRIAAEVGHATVHMWRPRPDLALPLVQVALSSTIPADPSVRLRAASIQSVAWAMTGLTEQAVSQMRSLAEVAEVADAESRLRFTADWVNVLLMCNRRREALPIAHRHAEMARAWGREDELRVALLNRSAISAHLGLLDDALADAIESHRLSNRPGVEAGTRLIAEAHMGRFLQAAGRFSAALAHLESARQGLRQLMPGSGWVANVECFEAETWLELGQSARAERILQPTDGGARSVSAKRLLALATVHRRTGRDARALLEQARAQAAGDSGLLVRLQASIELQAYADPEPALRQLDAVQEAATACDAVMLVLLAQARSLPLLWVLGRREEARQRAFAVLAQGLVLRGQAVYPPEPLWLAGRLLLDNGDVAQAGQALKAAADWIRDKASHHVPAPFVDSFLHRNPINRDVMLATAAWPVIPG